MANITISIDEALLKAGRKYAEKHQTSINGLIHKLLEETVRLRSSRRPSIAALSTACLSGILSSW